MRTDDVIDQIDAALHDHAVSGDAMRWTTEPASPDPEAALPRRGREILITRLIERHALTAESARAAVQAAERGTSSEAADLARAEANAVAAEMVTRIRVAMKPMAEAALTTLRQLGESIKQMQQQVPELAEAGRSSRRPGRPAWQTPYGPPQRRR